MDAVLVVLAVLAAACLFVGRERFSALASERGPAWTSYASAELEDLFTNLDAEVQRRNLPAGFTIAPGGLSW